MSSTLLDWALHLAEHDWPLFPLAVGSKKPAVRAWEKRATTDTDRITRCWGTGRYNIGLATGPAGLLVIDLDTTDNGEPDGAAGFAALATDRGVTVPDTWTVTTPSGGWHLYFTTPPGVRLRNTAGTLAPRIDTRAHGGYVVAPGSLLPNGGYELTDDTPPVELPAWIVQALTERAAPATSGRHEIAVRKPTAYATSALRGECQRVTDAPNGQHNAVLSSAAYRVGRLVGGGLLDHGTARTDLVAAARALITGECGCSQSEIKRVIDAGLTAGARNPRTGNGTDRKAA